MIKLVATAVLSILFGYALNVLTVSIANRVNSPLERTVDHTIEDRNFAHEVQARYVATVKVHFSKATIEPPVLTVTTSDNQQVSIRRPWDQWSRNPGLPFAVYRVDTSNVIRLELPTPKDATTLKVEFLPDEPNTKKAAIFSLVTAFLLLSFWFRNSPSSLAFIGIITVGIGYQIASPLAYVSWDELIHYRRADNHPIATLAPKHFRDIYWTTGTIPHSKSDQEQAWLNNHYDDAYRSSERIQHLSSDKNIQANVMLGAGSFAKLFLPYNMMAYSPSAFGLGVGRAASFDNSSIFRLGRLFNLLAYAALVLLAIRQVKGNMQTAVLLVALLPTSVFIAAHYGYDSWVNGWVMLAMCMFAATMHSERKRSTIYLLLAPMALFVGLGPKAIYFPLFGVFFLLQREAFKSIRAYWAYLMYVASLAFVALMSIVAPVALDGVASGDKRGGSDVESKAQILHILNDPIGYLNQLTEFLINYLNPTELDNAFTKIGYIGHTSGFLAILACFILVSIVKNDKHSATIHSWQRIYIFLLITATTALVATALYISFTPVGASHFAGVQKRYLLPLLMPMIFAFAVPLLENNGHSKLSINMLVTWLLTLLSLQAIWKNLIAPQF